MLKIEVTAEDIANGKPEDCERCPIALATRRTVPHAEYVDVDTDATWTTTEGDFRARLPDDARAFIENFDAGKPVEPFSFECDPQVRECYGDDEDDL